jgi:hypothetical protein
MPETPHEYVRRTPENEEAYALLFQKIGEEGVWEKFQGVRYQYYYRDGWKYWRMDGDLSHSKIINRAKVESAA